MKERIEEALEQYRVNSSPAVAQAMFRLHNEIFPKQHENPDSVSCYGCRERVKNKLINYLATLKNEKT